jgi:hypothetical protein
MDDIGDGEHAGHVRIGETMEGVSFLHIGSHPFAEKKGRMPPRESHGRHDGGDILRELTVDDIDGVVPEYSGKAQNDDWMEVSADVTCERGKSVAPGLPLKAAVGR